MTQRTRRLVAAALLVLGPTLLSVTPATAAKAEAKAKKTITVGDNFYKASKITVLVGDKVTWNFTGRGIHDVVVEKGPAKFHSQKRSYGYTFSKVLKKPGVYRIVCTLHPSMTMKITVQDLRRADDDHPRATFDLDSSTSVAISGGRDLMAGLLDGVRVIESSLLGPAAITLHLADLGAEVIKVEPPQGDYVRQMTWPIVEGVSLMHLHINRGKRSVTLDLRTPEGVEVYLDLVRGADAVVEAMRPGALAKRGLGYDEAARGEPGDRVLHDLGLRHDRSVQGHAEPRHRVRHVGRARRARVRRRRLLLHARAPVDGHPRRAVVRRVRDPRRHRARPGDG